MSSVENDERVKTPKTVFSFFIIYFDSLYLASHIVLYNFFSDKL